MPDISAETIQVLIQGGAVGLMLVSLFFGYRLISSGMEMVNTFVTNHVSHLISTLGKLEDTLERLDRRLEELVHGKKK